LGKKGGLTAVLRGMGALSADERPVIGALANEVREGIESGLAAKKTVLSQKEQDEKLKNEKIDVTMDGRRPAVGKRHPLTRALDEIKDIFLGMGFEIAEGPDVELDYYNFEALNIPKEHPARDTQDTFYVSENVVLRTQTSPVQIRVMEQKKPPIRIIAPGRVFRSDAVDATHSPVFHQIEGLVVDKGVTMGDLKGTLEAFAKGLYGPDARTRFRPHHFPFTEPSAEVDVSCFVCGGKGCRVCKGEGWIEILGCGMVHPKVLERCGVDPSVYSGFAFGMGLERLAMRRWRIDDLRLFYENDLRFLRQF
jgi:phenylalanyl-tRNA synthetase alpha chain